MKSGEVNRILGLGLKKSWDRCRLPAMPVGGPFELTVESLSDGQKVIVRDVWVGEVWLASGQSNMEWTLAQTAIRPIQAITDDEIKIVEGDK